LRRDPAIWLGELAAALERIALHVADLDRDDFLTSSLVQDAVAYNFIIVGEAAGNVSESIRERHLEVPWKQMSGMRNILAHEYFRLSPEILWETATRDLPVVLPLVQDVLTAEWDQNGTNVGPNHPR